MKGSFDHGNGPLGYIKVTANFSRKTLYHEISQTDKVVP